MKRDEWDGANLTPAELRLGKALVASALKPRGVIPIPDYSPADRLVLAILAANLSLQQSIRGKKSRNAPKRQVEGRRRSVNLLLRYVVEQKFRDDPASLRTVMEIVDWLDTACGIQATESKVRRDIHEALKLGALQKY
jgi:hypothetical protein